MLRLLLFTVSVMPCGLSVPASQLPAHLPPLAARLSRAVHLSQQLGDALLSWRLLARTEVHVERKRLLLTFLEPERELKATLGVALQGLLEPSLRAGEPASTSNVGQTLSVLHCSCFTTRTWPAKHTVSAHIRLQGSLACVA